MKKYPIGIQTFSEVINGGYVYVDKTKYIHRMATTGKHYFLSRPRRFGKSLLLSTINELFKGNKQLFKGLWIENNWDWTKNSPVIFLRFGKMDYQRKGLYEAINHELANIADQYHLQLNSETIKGRFNELIELLNVENQCVILIDEYDKPIIDFINQPQLAAENKAVLKELYSILKDADPLIKMLLITGVSKFSKVSIFSDLNNLNDLTLHRDYVALLGITQAELNANFKEEIKKLEGQNPSALSLIQQWYNGYSWNGQTKVYNPFSLLRFFQTEDFNNYWFETGTPTFLVDMIREKGEYQFDQKDYASILALSNIDWQNPDTTTILFQTGYLTIVEINFPEGWCHLRYPNKEVKDSLQQLMIASYRHSSTGESLPIVLQLRNAFNEKNIDKVVELINNTFATIPYDLWKNASELHYHALVHLIFTLLGSYITSEVNSSRGRCDAIIQTEKSIFAIEFKLDKSADEVLQQIREKGYLTPYGHIEKEKIALGINFSSEHKNVADWKIEFSPN